MFEAYRIGIRLTLLNGVTSGLMGIVGQFRTLDRQVNDTNKRLTETEALLVGIRRRMLVGGAMMATGGVGFGLIGKTVSHAKEYAHQLALMNVSGMKHGEIVKATQAAWNASKTMPTATAAENLAAIRDLRMVFGDTAHAIEFMPAVQKAQAILQMTRHGEPGSGKAEAYEMAKALEMKGAVRTPAEFLAQADLMTKALVATGGKVGASDFLSAFKYARGATSGWNNEFTYSILPTLIQEMKARGGSGGASGGPGSALMSAYAAVVGGTIPQKSLQVWNKLGLLDPSKVVWTRDGHAKGVGPGGIRGSEAFQENPYQWSLDFLVPALRKAGYTTEAQQKQALQYLFPDRTAGFVMSQFVTQAWKFERDRKLIAQAQGFGAYDQLLKTDPELAALALHKQWQNLLAILGYNIMPAVLKGMEWLIGLFQSLSTWFSEHSIAAKALMYSLAGLSGVLLIGGGGLTLWAGFSMLGMALQMTPIGGAAGLARIAVALGGGGLAGGLALLAASLALPAIANLFAPARKDDGKDHTGEHWVPGKGRGGAGGHWEGDDVDFRGRHVRSRAQAPVQVNTQINMDGRKVAEVVTEHQSHDASRPQGGVSRFDGRMNLAPVAAHGH